MEVKDVLFEVATKLDDETLLALYPIYRGQINALIGDNGFWYHRTQFRVGKSLTPRDVNWARVYQDIDQELSSRHLVKYESVLDYLPSLLVIEEAFGLPNWAKFDQRRVWSLISSPEVLEHLIGLRQLDKTRVRGLSAAAKKGRTQMIRPLYELLKETENKGDLIEKLSNACDRAISKGHLDTAEVLIDIMLETGLDLYKEEITLLRSAAREGSREMIELITSRLFKPSDWVMEDALFVAKPETIELLIDMGLVTLDQVRFQLCCAIARGAHSIIEFLDARGYVSALDWRGILKRAIEAKAEPEYVRHLLTKASPDRDIILLAMDIRHGEEVLKVIIEDPRVRVEEIGIDLAMDIYRRLSPVRGDFTGGFILGSKLAGEKPPSRHEIAAEMKSSGIYGLLLRVIFIKHPTGREILDWMIEQEDQQLQLTAESVVNGTISELVPIQALMLAIVYPTLSLQELITYLRPHADSDEIVRAGRLVGAHLTREGIEARYNADMKLP